MDHSRVEGLSLEGQEDVSWAGVLFLGKGVVSLGKGMKWWAGGW